MNPQPLVKTLDLCKWYAGGSQTVHTLVDVNLEIEQGDFISIMGSSGSGKSTLLHILGCLDAPSRGMYWLEGTPVHSMSPARLAEIRNSKLGFVFQSFHLLSRTTALENVELPLRYRPSFRPKEARERSLHALETVGLEERAAHYPNQLSGGQQQRVAIARAIVANPSLILADEPTGNLDSKMRLEIMELFQTLNKAGMTIVMVTHDPETAEFTNRRIILKDGRF